MNPLARSARGFHSRGPARGGQARHREGTAMASAILTGSPTVVIHAGAPQSPIAADNLVRVNFGSQGSPLGVLVALFLGDGPAQQFIQSLGQSGKGMTACPVPGLAELEVLLTDLKQRGVTHVDFNAKRNPIPIDDVIDSLRNRP